MKLVLLSKSKVLTVEIGVSNCKINGQALRREAALSELVWQAQAQGVASLLDLLA